MEALGEEECRYMGYAPTMSPTSDWNWMIMLAGSGASSFAILWGGSPLPRAIPGGLASLS